MNGLGTVDAGELRNLHGIGMVHIVIHLHAAAQPDWRFGLASNSKVSYLPKTKDHGGGEPPRPPRSPRPPRPLRPPRAT